MLYLTTKISGTTTSTFFQPISGNFCLTDILFFDQLGNISNIRHHIIRNHENIKIFFGTFDYILWYSRLNHITKITCVSVKLRDFANCFRSAPTTYLNFSLSWAQNLMMHKLCKIKNLKKRTKLTDFSWILVPDASIELEWRLFESFLVFLGTGLETSLVTDCTSLKIKLLKWKP